MTTGRDLIRTIAERCLKHRGLISATEAQQLARAVLAQMGGRR